MLMPKIKIGDKVIMPDIPNLPRNRKGEVIGIYPHYILCRVFPNNYLECINWKKEIRKEKVKIKRKEVNENV